MIIIYLAASIVGSILTAAMYIEHGLLFGLLTAPFGGAVYVLAAALVALPSAAPSPG
jgi:hypothetical protein